jgi:hypothetical protein
MAGKAAGPGGSGDKTGPGKRPGSPDPASPAGQAESRDGADQPDQGGSADEAQLKFREALERKRAREAGTVGAAGDKDPGRIHGAHGPARNRRSFRRKSG